MKSINSKLWFDINPIIKENDFGNLISEIIELKLNNENYLLINGLTGAIDIVNFEEYDCIFKRKDNSVYKNTYLNLCKRGYYLTNDNTIYVFKN
jgi:hypothetical protein